MTATDDLPLVDHHCHGVLADALGPDVFRALSTESAGEGDPAVDVLDSPYGLALGRRCAPLLGLEPHPTPEAYLERRGALGAAEVNRRMMSAAGLSALLIDTGHLAYPLLTPEEMEDAFAVPSHEIVRLERLAEDLAEVTDAGDFMRAFDDALTAAARSAVGFKSVIAYRYGLDIAGEPPAASAVAEAVEEWYRESERRGTRRVSSPVLLNHLLWASVRHGLPIQLHVGFGDSDIQLFRADPSRATRFLAATADSGARIMLLHCYPFEREAALLAHVFPHVYCDVGEVSHHLGPSAGIALRRMMEAAPFGKVMFSSDAHGLAEHYAMSALGWREAMGALLDDWIASGWATPALADRIARAVAHDNAERVYGLRDGR